MIDVISTCIDGFSQRNLGLISENIIDDCLLLNSNSNPILGKPKIIKYFEDLHKQYKQLSINLLNSAKDSHDTLLISWAFRGKGSDDTNTSLFGTSVVNFNIDQKVTSIRSTIINA